MRKFSLLISLAILIVGSVGFYFYVTSGLVTPTSITTGKDFSVTILNESAILSDIDAESATLKNQLEHFGVTEKGILLEGEVIRRSPKSITLVFTDQVQQFQIQSGNPPTTLISFNEKYDSDTDALETRVQVSPQYKNELVKQDKFPFLIERAILTRMYLYVANEASIEPEEFSRRQNIDAPAQVESGLSANGSFLKRGNSSSLPGRLLNLANQMQPEVAHAGYVCSGVYIIELPHSEACSCSAPGTCSSPGVCGDEDEGTCTCGTNCQSGNTYTCSGSCRASCSGRCCSDRCSSYYLADPTPVPPSPGCGTGPACTGAAQCCTDGVCRVGCKGPPQPTDTPQVKTCAGNICGPTEYCCLDESACKPLDAKCGGTQCTNDYHYGSSTVWARVFSKEGNNVVFWKGTQANDPIQAGNDTWSGGAPGPDGYFPVSSKPFWADPWGEFRRENNRIDPAMDIQVITEPYPEDIQVFNPADSNERLTPPSPEVVEIKPGWPVYLWYGRVFPSKTNTKCPAKTTVSTLTYPNGSTEQWSNHFCGGGMAYREGSNGILEDAQYRYATNATKCAFTEGNCGKPDGCERDCYQDVDGCSYPGFVSPNSPPGKDSFGEINDLWQYQDWFLGKDWGANSASLTSKLLKYSNFWTFNQKMYHQQNGSGAFHYAMYLKPPTGYSCGKALQLNGSTWSELQPEIKDTYCIYRIDNGRVMVFPEVTKSFNNTCQINVTTADLNVPGDVHVVSSGKASNNRKNLTWVQFNAVGLSDDTRPTANGKPAGFTRARYGNSKAKAFYFDNGNYPGNFWQIYTNLGLGIELYMWDMIGQLACEASNNQYCDPRIQFGLNFIDYAGVSGDTVLKDDYYFAYCEVPNPPAYAPDGKCTGSPVCAFNRDKLNKLCTYVGLPSNCANNLPLDQCDGWRPCAPDAASATQFTDLAVLKVGCEPSCKGTSATNRCVTPTTWNGCGVETDPAQQCQYSSFCSATSTNANKSCLTDPECPGGSCDAFVSAIGTGTMTGLTTTFLSQVSSDVSAIWNTCTVPPASVTLNWTKPTNVSANFKYEVMVFQGAKYLAGGNSLAQAATMAEGDAAGLNSTVKKFTGLSTTTTTLTLPTTVDMGPHMLIAIRATNTDCGGDGPWYVIERKLTCDTTASGSNLRVELVKVTPSTTITTAADRCQGTGEYLDPTTNPKVYDPLTAVHATIKLSPSLPLTTVYPYGLLGPTLANTNQHTPANLISVPFGQDGSSTFANIGQLWYLPTSWWNNSYSYQVGLNRSIGELAAMNLVLACPTGSTTQNISIPDASGVGTGIVKFFVKAGFPAWWRTVGGLIGSNAGTIDSKIPPSCASDASCLDSLDAVLPQAGKTTFGKNAGLAIAGGGGTVTAGSGSRTQQLNQPFAGGSLTLSTKYNYAYFDDLVTKSGVTPFILTTDLQSIGPKRDKVPTTNLGDGRKYYVWKIGTATVSLPAPVPGGDWQIGDDEVVVILVDGDITFNTLSSVANLISVSSRGFLIVVARGNIIFNNSVGTPIALGEPSNVITPNVSGIFISDGTLTIADDTDAVSDNRFIGKGVFAGLSGVSLNREFDDTTTGMGREINNLHAVETFVHDPQLVLNTPNFLKELGLSFQEIQ